MITEDAHPKVDRHPMLERVSYGAGSALGLVASLGVLYQLCVHPEPRRSVGDTIAAVLQWEFFLALFLFSCVGLAWALTASERLEDLFGQASWKALLLLAVWLLVGAICGIVFGG